MTSCGITPKEQENILYMISGILHTGNISFREDKQKVTFSLFILY
jgi:myosin heavy subunit